MEMVSGDGDAAGFNRLQRPAQGQEWSGQAEVGDRPESLPRTETNAGVELSGVVDLNPAFLGGDVGARSQPGSADPTEASDGRLARFGRIDEWH
jgi:hypothetical protein